MFLRRACDEIQISLDDQVPLHTIGVIHKLRNEKVERGEIFDYEHFILKEIRSILGYENGEG